MLRCECPSSDPDLRKPLLASVATGEDGPVGIAACRSLEGFRHAQTNPTCVDSSNPNHRSPQFEHRAGTAMRHSCDRLASSVRMLGKVSPGPAQESCR